LEALRGLKERGMFQHRGGTVVGRGTYWNLKNGEREVVKCDTTLPGNAHTRYLKAPTLFMVLMGPVIGFFYVLILPFVGLAMLVTSQISQMLYEAFGRTAAFGWRPVEAYLMSRKNKKAARRDEQARGLEAEEDNERS
jgi:hypothetical protein